ncbi:MAG: hypothetical protein KC443_20785 [Anaerolineales bacterium]|nr:hypothetical protein [Anaerolineales bacterium]
MQRIVYVLLFIVGFVCWGAVGTGYAQGSIVVAADAAIVEFPDTITFRIEAESTADIEQVTLLYGTNGRSCQSGGSRQPLTFDADTAVSLDWEWELKRSGALPPGVQVWWQWELEDADGNVHLTDRQEIVVEDTQRSWRTLSNNGVTVQWYQGSTAFGQAMLDEAERALTRLESVMGVLRPETTMLWVYPTADDVRDAVLNVPEWTGGVAFPDYGITVIGVAPGQEDWAARIIPHELSHLVVGMRTFNCRGVRLPTWLDEGLSRYSENNIDPNEIAQVEAALMDGRLPPLRSLASGFSAYGSSASLSYTQSYQAVQYLIETYGPEQMTELLVTMQAGSRIDEALLQVYGFDTAGLDARWRETTGYAATPTSEADSLAAQATPTMVPTLALAAPVVPATATPTGTPLATATLPATAVATITETASPTAMSTATPLPPETEGAVLESVPTPTPASTAVGSASPTWLLAGGAMFLALVIVFVIFIQRRGK